VNWQSLANQLRNHAPLCQISRKLGKNPGWLSTISRGEISEPRFADGIRLLDYAADVLGDEIRRFRC
jgi:hypothetical protein